jgi:PAS domain S-box-containing protein
MENSSKKERQSLSILIMIFIIFSAGIVTVGHLYYQRYKKHYRVGVECQLSAIAELKVDELVDWRNERLGDAGIFYKNAVFSALVRRYFEKPDNMDAQGQIRTWLSQIQAAYKYDGLMLLDTQYSKKIIVPDGPERITSFVSQSASEILRSGKVAFEDFYRNEQNQRIYLKILVPILDEANDNRPIGILALRIDPEKYLYPFINHWPIPSRTAETLLVRREGNEVLFLNELRFKKNTALNLRVPLDGKKELPAVKAVLGQEGIVQGIDYHGVPVIACVRAVPDSPWFMVARMDISEVYAPLKERLWVIIVLVGTLLTGASAGVGFLWKQKSARFYRQKYGAAEAKRESEAKYRTLVENLPQRIFLKDEHSIYISCNENYARDLKIKSEEIAGKTDYDFYPKELAEKYRADDKRITESGKTEDFEEKYIQEGKEFIVQTVKTPIKDEQGNIIGVLGIFRDITERKQAEQELLCYQSQLKSLTGKLFFTEQRERRKLALSVHEQIGQKLSLALLYLKKLRTMVSDSALIELLSKVSAIVEQTVRDAHRLTFELSNPVLYELGLDAALEHYLAEQVQGQFGVKCELSVQTRPLRLEGGLAMTLFRAVQELVVNVLKHAKASTIRINVRQTAREVQIVVQDDGAGFLPSQQRFAAARKDLGGFGLFGIREQMEYLGGRMTVDSVPGQGTRVSLTVPIKPPDPVRGQQI